MKHMQSIHVFGVKYQTMKGQYIKAPIHILKITCTFIDGICQFHLRHGQRLTSVQ